MNKLLSTTVACLFLHAATYAQPCTPTGNPSVYGTNDTWIGYLYDNRDFTNYRGFITRGSPGNPNFDEQFSGDNVLFPTSSCTVQTETFSARFRLTKTFSSGAYEFIIGGDDGYRLSIDGGATWLFGDWNDHAYQTSSHTIHLDGSYNLVLEYNENSGGNRVSFAVSTACMGYENTAQYGTGNTWRGYVYDGMNFSAYKGMVTEGSAASPSFFQNFGGSNVLYPTSSCQVQTETFSVRYRLTRNFASGPHTFIVGGDDGYRLSLDGGATWVINQWHDQSYTTTTYSATFGGPRDLVLEFYENGGDNRISFTYQYMGTLPVKLLAFTGKEKNGHAELAWDITRDSDAETFTIEKSSNGIAFAPAATVGAASGQPVATGFHFTHTDPAPLSSTCFYRLKITDRSGIVTLSPVVAISNTKQTNDITVFPTTVRGSSLYIKTNRALKQPRVELYEPSGRYIAGYTPGKTEAGQVIAWNSVPPLPSGACLVRITDQGVPVATQWVVKE